ncbi:MAG: J domain-containing protein [Gammaproteobacteria bacterium]
MAARGGQNQRNLYRVLYVQPDAPPAIIQASYRTLMQKLRAHPDLGGDAWNAAVINRAFEVLSDPRKRRAYDEALFGRRNLRSLGRQNAAQRRRGDTAAQPWQPFVPREIR